MWSDLFWIFSIVLFKNAALGSQLPTLASIKPFSSSESTLRDRVCLLQIDEASDAYSFFAMVTNSNWIG
jgi:hypothetical protein